MIIEADEMFVDSGGGKVCTLSRLRLGGLPSTEDIAVEMDEMKGMKVLEG